MNFEITDKAKEKLLLMKEQNLPITIMRYPAGLLGIKYIIVSAKQTENDKLYNVNGFDIIVSGDCEFENKTVRIDYGGLVLKDFIVTPKVS